MVAPCRPGVGRNDRAMARRGGCAREGNRLTIRSILVPVPDGNSAPSVHAALIAAETFHTHVEGLHVPHIAPSSSPRDRHFAFSASGGVVTDEAVAGIREAIFQAEMEMERTAGDGADR